MNCSFNMIVDSGFWSLLYAVLFLPHAFALCYGVATFQSW